MLKEKLEGFTDSEIQDTINFIGNIKVPTYRKKILALVHKELENILNQRARIVVTTTCGERFTFNPSSQPIKNIMVDGREWAQKTPYDLDYPHISKPTKVPFVSREAMKIYLGAVYGGSWKAVGWDIRFSSAEPHYRKKHEQRYGKENIITLRPGILADRYHKHGYVRWARKSSPKPTDAPFKTRIAMKLYLETTYGKEGFHWVFDGYNANKAVEDLYKKEAEKQYGVGNVIILYPGIAKSRGIGDETIYKQGYTRWVRKDGLKK